MLLKLAWLWILYSVVSPRVLWATLVFETYDKDAPKASENFVTLAEKGYYNGLVFHRVVAGFVAQGGDPLCTKNPADDKGACGTGGPGYRFEDELNRRKHAYQRMIVYAQDRDSDSPAIWKKIMEDERNQTVNITISLDGVRSYTGPTVDVNFRVWNA